MDLYGYMLLAVPVSHRVRAALMARCVRGLYHRKCGFELGSRSVLSCGSYASMKST